MTKPVWQFKYKRHSTTVYMRFPWRQNYNQHGNHLNKYISTVILTRVHSFNPFTAYRTLLFIFRKWMKSIENWKRKEAALVVAHIIETETSLLLPNSPSPATLKVVILTTSSADKDENLIQLCKYNKNYDTSVSVIILLDIHITHRCLLLMAYVTVWDGAVITIHIQIVLFNAGWESVDTMDCYFGECATVCHLLRQVADFSAFCLRIFFCIFCC